MDNMIIVGKDCKSCIHCSINEAIKSKIIVKCSVRDKTYIWGQCIPCKDRKIK